MRYHVTHLVLGTSQMVAEKPKNCRIKINLMDLREGCVTSPRK